jgi:hypothetical protein
MGTHSRKHKTSTPNKFKFKLLNASETCSSMMFMCGKPRKRHDGVEDCGKPLKVRQAAEECGKPLKRCGKPLKSAKNR